jgi:hypothetical protein
LIFSLVPLAALRMRVVGSDARKMFDGVFENAANL